MDEARPLRTFEYGKIKHGYRLLRVHGHPNARGGGIIAEHRLVMSEMLGRALLPGESVHHRNGDRLDNRPENLELWVTMQPSGQRPDDLVADAVEVLRRYAPDRLDRTYKEESR